jgi:hypothetical protein
MERAGIADRAHFGNLADPYFSGRFVVVGSMISC